MVGNASMVHVFKSLLYPIINFHVHLYETIPMNFPSEIFLSCTSARQKKSRAFYRQVHAVQFMSTAPQFSMLFLFKINN
jgi:hypothetical protein